jgi:hypothetical protein
VIFLLLLLGCSPEQVLLEKVLALEDENTAQQQEIMSLQVEQRDLAMRQTVLESKLDRFSEEIQRAVHLMDKACSK